MTSKIGVFDSGIGGLSVANAIEAALPSSVIVFRNDQENMPYGKRSAKELFKLALPIIKGLEEEGCDAIVVACNTVTTTIIDRLRQEISVPLIAIEPMVKTAAEITKTKKIAVCATPTTLKSKRYKELKASFAEGIKIIEPNCSDWAAMIEHNEIDDQKITRRIKEVLGKDADVIVLACTHYHWIEDKIKNIAKSNAVIIQPETAIIKQIKRVLNVA